MAVARGRRVSEPRLWIIAWLFPAAVLTYGTVLFAAGGWMIQQPSLTQPLISAFYYLQVWFPLAAALLAARARSPFMLLVRLFLVQITGMALAAVLTGMLTVTSTPGPNPWAALHTTANPGLLVATVLLLGATWALGAVALAVGAAAGRGRTWIPVLAVAGLLWLGDLWIGPGGGVRSPLATRFLTALHYPSFLPPAHGGIAVPTLAQAPIPLTLGGMVLVIVLGIAAATWLAARRRAGSAVSP